MIRAFNLVMLAFTVAVCFGLYRVTYDAQEREAELKHVEAQIAEQERSIGVLKAEWTHLAQPAKMQAMATRYLDLQPMKATQIAYVNDIPMRRTEATMDDISAIPFTRGEAGGEDAPAPRVKPQGLGR